MLCKYSKKRPYQYLVHEPVKRTANGVIVTKFYIEDFIKNVKSSKKRYWVTVFEDLDLEDGDYIKLLDFDELVTSMNPNTKHMMQFISANVTVTKAIDYKESKEVEESPYE